MTALIEGTREELRPDRRVYHVGKMSKIGREMRMTTQIGDYDMDYIIFYLGSNVNILIRRTCQKHGKTVTRLVSHSSQARKSVEGPTYWLTDLGACRGRRPKNICGFRSDRYCR